MTECREIRKLIWDLLLVMTPTQQKHDSEATGNISEARISDPKQTVMILYGLYLTL